MDEIDAALDFRNVSIVANYIKDRTKCASLAYDCGEPTLTTLLRLAGTPNSSSSRFVT